MGDRLFLHEYVGDIKTASVYRDLATNKYWVLGYQNSSQHLQELFNTEHEAEDYAEDWVDQPQQG